MITRRHAMPFGAELRHDGGVRFRLWAPAAERVEVCIGSGVVETTLNMAREQDGWFGLVTDAATAGSLYTYRIDDGIRVPDPASRFQPQDVHGPSQVIDPAHWRWTDIHWRGRPWREAVVYELHVGSFTTEGTFEGVIGKLDYLAQLGVTAVELMPVADFPGSRNWGYDGVLPFAPDCSYGTSDQLKALVQTAHSFGLMVFLDVVYNHFGPEGNYLHSYAPQFFTERHHTPWGAAINFDGDHSHWVRQYVIHNALYWLQEFHLDGLRLDAVHSIMDDSEPDILTELADTVHQTVGRDRHVHLILENDHNAARYLRCEDDGRPRWYTAQWNDDLHHALHVLATGETDGYYADYAHQPAEHLRRTLTEGFAYQGEPSPYRHGQARGEASGHLPATAFIGFLQNHDQVGNRAFGERLSALCPADRLRAVSAVLLLAPSPPLLFMGQEWASEHPFLFFCDFEPELAAKVSAGRRDEFSRFAQFSTAAARERIPDPCQVSTFRPCVLDWHEPDLDRHAEWLDWHRALLRLRQQEIAPRLPAMPGLTRSRALSERAMEIHWTLSDGAKLTLLTNLGDEMIETEPPLSGRVLHATDAEPQQVSAYHTLPPWSALWLLS